MGDNGGDLTPEEAKKLRELIESWDSVNAAIHVLMVIGNTIKWIAAVGAAVVIVYSVWTGKRL